MVQRLTPLWRVASSSLSMTCLEGLAGTAIYTQAPFGNYALGVHSSDPVTLVATGGNTFQTRFKFSTKYIPTGVYSMRFNGQMILAVADFGSTFTVRISRVSPSPRLFSVVTETITIAHPSATSSSGIAVVPCIANKKLLLYEGINFFVVDINTSIAGVIAQDFHMEMARMS